MNANDKLTSLVSGLSSAMDVVPTDAQPLMETLAGMEGVIFDVYGTMLLSGSGEVGTAKLLDHASAMTDSLRAVGLRGVSDECGHVGGEALKEAIVACHAGKKEEGMAYPEVEIRDVWKDVLRVLRDRCGLEGVLDAQGIEQLAIHYEARVNPVWPMPGIREVLPALRAKRMALGIVSNAQFYTQHLFPALLGSSLEELGFDPALCVWSYRVGEAKPSETLFDQLLTGLQRRGGPPPDQCVYVGNDMLNDVTAASRAGLRTVLFAGDARSLRWRKDDPRCDGISADAVITEWPQLLEILV